MEISIKRAESQPLPERIDTGKATITKPELIKAYNDFETAYKENKPLTVAEQLRFGRLKKYGDKAQGLNKFTKCPNKPTQHLDIAKLNKAPLNITEEKAQFVIDNINDGLTFIQSCEKESIKPKDFLKFIDEPNNQELKQAYYNSRILLAEWYLERRERLEKDLRTNQIDSATYSTLANDYKYLAGKLAPLAYGDKIQLDAQINKTQTFELINSDKVKQLNSLLNPDIIDAEYQETE